MAHGKCWSLADEQHMLPRLQGFRVTLDAILQNLPRQRQTMLFSATQTKSVS
jgi:superfamily II DNA/RNA helicase